MRQLAIAVTTLLVASLAAAQSPTITSVTPAAGPVSGGTNVVITGSAFHDCVICSPPVPPAAVYFGGVRASSVQVLNETTIKAVAPAHLPGLVDVRVQLYDGSATMPQAFEYGGNASDAFETILLPLWIPPVHGQFGSEFFTALRTWNTGAAALPIYGLQIECINTGSCPAPAPFSDPAVIEPNASLDRFVLAQNGTPGRLLYVPRSGAEGLQANLRAFDVSVSTLNYGTSLPVVRESDFRRDRIALLGVPTDARFRNMLRIYGLEPGTVQVTIDDKVWLVDLRPGGNQFEPAYGEFTTFPVTGAGGPVVALPPNNIATLFVTPLAPAGPPEAPLIGTPPRVWAFITVTNNTTQTITTIEPRH